MSRGLFGKQILVLESEPFISLDLVSALEQIGANVVVAPNVRRAHEILKLRHFVAAVIDPDASEETRTLCAYFKENHIPFIVHSGGNVVVVGAADTISKPALASTIATAVASALQRSNALLPNGRREFRNFQPGQLT